MNKVAMRQQEEISNRLNNIDEILSGCNGDLCTPEEMFWRYYKLGIQWTAGLPEDSVGEKVLMQISKPRRYQELRDKIMRCRLCGLAIKRKGSPVPGTGSLTARLVIIGEAPGLKEEQTGIPFHPTAAAGSILREALHNVGINDKDIFIANTVCCRPASIAEGRENDPPDEEHKKACYKILLEQIALIEPKVIVTLGAIATQWLLKTDKRIGMLRGIKNSFNRIPLIASWHPSYIARGNRRNMDQLENDLKIAKEIMEE